jgi:hypothetical protein
MLSSTCLQAELIHIEEAIEAYDLRINTYGGGSGHVMVRSCKSCKPERLLITPSTTISVKGVAVPLDRTVRQHDAGGVVIFNPETRQVVRVIL